MKKPWKRMAIYYYAIVSIIFETKFWWFCFYSSAKLTIQSFYAEVKDHSYSNSTEYFMHNSMIKKEINMTYFL